MHSHSHLQQIRARPPQRSLFCVAIADLLSESGGGGGER